MGYDSELERDSLVFIAIVRSLFLGIISGILLSAILAAAMSTASSQLLAAASTLASDVYRSGEHRVLIGRLAVLGIACVSLTIASNPDSGSIMDLVMNAWGLFGSTFGPVILLSLFWKRFNLAGAIAGILTGAITDICWAIWFSSTGIYELGPGFVTGAIGCVVASICTTKPSEDVEQLFERSQARL